MKKLKEINYWGLPDTYTEADGFDRKTVPALSAKNLEFVMEEHNKVVVVVNELIEKTNVLRLRTGE